MQAGRENVFVRFETLHPQLPDTKPNRENFDIARAPVKVAFGIPFVKLANGLRLVFVHALEGLLKHTELAQGICAGRLFDFSLTDVSQWLPNLNKLPRSSLMATNSQDRKLQSHSGARGIA